jgi:hypothetical protein
LAQTCQIEQTAGEQADENGYRQGAQVGKHGLIPVQLIQYVTSCRAACSRCQHRIPIKFDRQVR